MKKSYLILFLCLLISLPVRADFNDGVVAYLMGEYNKSYSTMRSLAESSNHAYAQYYVGMMHLNGQGVEQNYKEGTRRCLASKWRSVAPDRRSNTAMG